MGKSFEAKTTRYKNINFKSKLEAQFAYLLDLLHAEWVYEPEAYNLYDNNDAFFEEYTPDFCIFKNKGKGFETFWVETKGAFKHSYYFCDYELKYFEQFGYGYGYEEFLAFREEKKCLFWSTLQPVLIIDKILNPWQCDLMYKLNNKWDAKYLLQDKIFKETANGACFLRPYNSLFFNAWEEDERLNLAVFLNNLENKKIRPYEWENIEKIYNANKLNDFIKKYPTNIEGKWFFAFKKMQTEINKKQTDDLQILPATDGKNFMLVDPRKDVFNHFETIEAYRKAFQSKTEFIRGNYECYRLVTEKVDKKPVTKTSKTFLNEKHLQSENGEFKLC